MDGGGLRKKFMLFWDGELFPFSRELNVGVNEKGQEGLRVSAQYRN